jgi:hypothetical protein
LKLEGNVLLLTGFDAQPYACARTSFRRIIACGKLRCNVKAGDPLRCKNAAFPCCIYAGRVDLELPDSLCAARSVFSKRFYARLSRSSFNNSFFEPIK